MYSFYLLLHLITVVMFSAFVANVVKTTWNNLIKQVLRTVLKSKGDYETNFPDKNGVCEPWIVSCSEHANYYV